MIGLLDEGGGTTNSQNADNGRNIGSERDKKEGGSNNSEEQHLQQMISQRRADAFSTQAPYTSHATPPVLSAGQVDYARQRADAICGKAISYRAQRTVGVISRSAFEEGLHPHCLPF